MLDAVKVSNMEEVTDQGTDNDVIYLKCLVIYLLVESNDKIVSIAGADQDNFKRGHLELGTHKNQETLGGPS